MNRNISSIIDGLHGKTVSGYGTVNESGDYKTIAGVRAKVDKDGKVIDEKAKKLIEKRLGKPIDEATKEDETEKEIDEDEWKTMHGAHILVDDEGGIKVGGPEHMRKKSSKEEIKKGVEDANKKSKEDAEAKESEKKDDVSNKVKQGLDKFLSGDGYDSLVDDIKNGSKWSREDAVESLKNQSYKKAFSLTFEGDDEGARLANGDKPYYTKRDFEGGMEEGIKKHINYSSDLSKEDRDAIEKAYKAAEDAEKLWKSDSVRNLAKLKDRDNENPNTDTLKEDLKTYGEGYAKLEKAQVDLYRAVQKASENARNARIKKVYGDNEKRVAVDSDGRPDFAQPDFNRRVWKKYFKVSDWERSSAENKIKVGTMDIDKHLKDAKLDTKKISKETGMSEGDVKKMIDAYKKDAAFIKKNKKDMAGGDSRWGNQGDLNDAVKRQVQRGVLLHVFGDWDTEEYDD